MWVSKMRLPAQAGHARWAARHELAGIFLSVATTMAAMLATVPAQAQIDATWSANPAAGNNFNDPGNWVPPTAVPTGTASFGSTTANGTIPTITLPTTVAGINFLSSAPRYNFAVTHDLTISGASGITNSSGLSQNFVVLPPATMLFQNSTTGASATAFGNRGGTLVFNNSSAGAASIENQVSGSGTTPGNINFVNGRAGNAIISNDFGSATITFSDASNADSGTLNNFSSGGTIVFSDTSTASNATIANFVAGSFTTFQGTSSAGSATVTANSGTTVNFTGSSSGSQGRFIVNSGGVFDISALSGTGTTSGSIEGAGSFLLGSKQLTTGLNNLSTTVSGVIADGGAVGGAGGSLVKTGSGTLTLTGQNTYTGGTTISGGTLQLGNGGTSGSIVGNVTDNGTLSFNRSDVVTFPGTISGTGGVTQAGAGTVILTASNTYAGGTTINTGTLQLGNGGTSGSIVGNVTDNGTLSFNRSDVVTFPGTISGTGGVTQAGSGAAVLTAISTYTGSTTVAAGTLAVGDPGHTSAALAGGGAITVAQGATLGGYGSVGGTVTNAGTVAAGNATLGFGSAGAGTFTIGQDLLNNGTVNLHPVVGNVLAVTGNYAASGPARLLVSTVLNAGGALSNQFTDRLLIKGNASGTTTVVVSNANGSGALTTLTPIPNPIDGISIVQVGGSSSVNAFILPGGYATGGTPFQYHLNAYGPGASQPADTSQSLVGGGGNHWDYRLQTAYVDPPGVIPPEPEPPPPPAPPPPPPPGPIRPEVAPQVPSYISTPRALFQAQMLDIGTLHQRLGEIRDDQTMGRAHQAEIFARGYGGSFNYTTNRSFEAFGYNFSNDYGAMQVGANYLLPDNQDGTLRVGFAGMFGRLWMQPSAVDGASKTLYNTQNLALTGTWQSTAGWYVDGILMGGFFDGRTTTDLRGKTTGMNGHSVAVSVEGGMPFAIPWQNLQIEPQAQIIWQHLAFDDRTDVDGIGVDMGSPNQVTGRFGFRVLQSFQDESGMRFTPYLKANLLQSLSGSSKVTLSGIGFGTGQLGTMLQVGGGATGTLTKNLSLYGDVSWQSDVGGNGGFRGWVFNAGLRWVFGTPAPTPPPITPAVPMATPARTYLVFFDWDKADLTARARQIIAEAAQNSSRVQVTRIEVNGHTDRTGSTAYNQGLSERRARNVTAELVRDGVPQNIISLQGFGYSRPLVPTAAGVREPQNRRVEIILQ